jgi:hypothetical protein
MNKSFEETLTPEKNKKEYVKPKCETQKPLDHVGYTYYYTYTYVYS